MEDSQYISIDLIRRPPQPPDPLQAVEPLLDCAAAAAVLGGLHPKTVERWAREGRVPAYHYFRHWKFRASELEVWMLSHINSAKFNRWIIEKYPTESRARTASMSLLLSINQEKPEGVPVPFGAVIERYLAQELPEGNSTASHYRSWLKNYIKAKWAECSLDQIKPLAVEDWLKKLSLAPKSKSHLKNLMRVLFNAAMRWELIPYQLNPMSLVRVKDGSKRKREPKTLSADEFRRMLEHISEPFRTMCIVAICMGLRVSEILGLKWCDVDWEGMRPAIRQSFVYGISGAVKTPASQRWMPLDRSLAEKMRQHQLRFASPLNTEGWIFANPDTGKPYWPGRIQENWLAPQRKGWD